jgi:hypothetical protein
MNNWILSCCLLLLGYAQIESSQPNRKSGVISGHVLYKDGSPVNGAKVKIYYFGGVDTIFPLSTRTDEKGYYSFTPPPFGKGVLSASKVGEGYPDAELAIYGRTGFEQLPRVDVKEGVVFEPIDLKFGEPDAWIEWTVLSDVTHEPIKNARYTVSWSDDPRMIAGDSIDVTGRFSCVLPKHSVTLKITAPGYADWVYRDEKTGSQSLLIKPATHDQRTVFLKTLSR